MYKEALAMKPFFRNVLGIGLQAYLDISLLLHNYGVFSTDLK